MELGRQPDIVVFLYDDDFWHAWRSADRRSRPIRHFFSIHRMCSVATWKEL